MFWLSRRCGKKTKKMGVGCLTDYENPGSSGRPKDWTPKVYILQKDIPSLHRGTIFQQSFQSDNVYFHAIPISGRTPEKDQVGIVKFEAKYVENNPEWFLSEEEAAEKYPEYFLPEEAQ